MEGLPYMYLFSVDKVSRRIAEIHARLLVMWNPNSTVQYVMNCIRTFTDSVWAKQSFIGDELISNAWLELKKLSPRPECHVQTPTTLYTALMQLLNCSVAFEAQECFLKQIPTVWKPIRQRQLQLQLSIEEEEIKNLFQLKADYIISEISCGRVNDVVKTSNERKYAMDTVRIGKIFTGTDIPEQYKICMWNLCESDNFRIKKLQDILNIKWPQKTREEKYDKYCSIFNQLYDVVSNIDKNRPVLIPLHSCEPTAQDFEEYASHFISRYGEDICFVAKTMYYLNKNAHVQENTDKRISQVEPS